MLPNVHPYTLERNVWEIQKKPQADVAQVFSRIECSDTEKLKRRPNQSFEQKTKVLGKKCFSFLKNKKKTELVVEIGHSRRKIFHVSRIERRTWCAICKSLVGQVAVHPHSYFCSGNLALRCFYKWRHREHLFWERLIWNSQICFGNWRKFDSAFLVAPCC